MEESKTDRVTPPTTPNKAMPSPPKSDERPTVGLSSPELLNELKQEHALKHVPAHTGLTTVFCGRGRGRQNQEAESVKKPALKRQQSQ